MIVFQAFVVHSGNGADTLSATIINPKLVEAGMIVYPKRKDNGVARRRSATVNVNHESAKAAPAVHAVCAAYTAANCYPTFLSGGTFKWWHFPVRIHGVPEIPVALQVQPKLGASLERLTQRQC